MSLTGDGKDYNNVDFGTHVGDKAVLATENADYKNIINSINNSTGLGIIYTNMTENQMKHIVEAQQRSTADELGYEKIGDTYYIVIKNQVSDENIGLNLSEEDRKYFIEKTHEWREIINLDNKNIYYQVENNLVDDASVTFDNTQAYINHGKILTNNVLLTINSRSMENSIYTNIVTNVSLSNGRIIYNTTGLTFGQTIDHEGIHVTDNLLNGMAFELKNGKYEKSQYEEENKMIYNKNKTYIIDYKYPISEKRAMEQSEILNRINNESVIRRPFYNDKSLTRINELF